MRLVGNALNGYFLDNLIGLADRDELDHIVVACSALVDMDSILDLAERRKVPLSVYTVVDPGRNPALAIAKRLVERSPPSWRLYLTRRFFHANVIWFKGAGCYIGSAGLSDEGRWRNFECGVWFDQQDVLERGLDDQLQDMLHAIRDRSAPATVEDLKKLEELRRARGTRLAPQLKQYDDAADRTLDHLPGQESPLVVAGAREEGGVGRRAFLQRWTNTLTILRKLAVMARGVPWPSWVDPEVPATIVSDQATEHYYQRHVRYTGQSAETIRALHQRNRKDPDMAARRVFEEWSQLPFDESKAPWLNEHPSALRSLLHRTALDELDVDRLSAIVFRTHAARDHGRQMANAVLGLPPGAVNTVNERARIYAEYLLRQRSAQGKTIADLLRYVLWGDRDCIDAAERIWHAAHTPKWRLAHMGINILGEMIGYARPEEFPPRNDRVARTLVALGYDADTL